MSASGSFTTELSPVNLNKIQYWINAGRLDPSQPITLRELSKSRCIHGVARDGVKLLARGKDELTTPVNIIVSRASVEAINAVERAGGTVTTRYYTEFAVKKVKQSLMDPIHSLQSRIALSEDSETGAVQAADALADERKRYQYRLPDPTSRKDLEYYRDSAHRGYLSHLVAEGHGPSLFFRTPGTGSRLGKKAGAKVRKSSGSESNRLW
jgi:large subunit ribosomal protein L15